MDEFTKLIPQILLALGCVQLGLSLYYIYNNMNQVIVMSQAWYGLLMIIGALTLTYTTLFFLSFTQTFTLTWPMGLLFWSSSLIIVYVTYLNQDTVSKLRIIQSSRQTAEKTDPVAKDTITDAYSEEFIKLALENTLKIVNLGGPESVVFYLKIDQLDEISKEREQELIHNIMRHVAHCLLRRCRRGDLVARVNQQEFIILFSSMASRDIEILANEFCDLILKNEYEEDKEIFSLTTSIGVLPLTKKFISVPVVLHEARKACMNAYNQGGNRIGTLPDIKLQYL